MKSFCKNCQILNGERGKMMFPKQIIEFLLCCPLQMLCRADLSLFREKQDLANSQETFHPLSQK